MYVRGLLSASRFQEAMQSRTAKPLSRLNRGRPFYKWPTLSRADATNLSFDSSRRLVFFITTRKASLTLQGSARICSLLLYRRGFFICENCEIYGKRLSIFKYPDTSSYPDVIIISCDSLVATGLVLISQMEMYFHGKGNIALK